MKMCYNFPDFAWLTNSLCRVTYTVPEYTMGWYNPQERLRMTLEMHTRMAGHKKTKNVINSVLFKH